MKNKGFTLIELIATIALLGILALISFVSISKVIENSKDRECQTLVKSIKTATKEYASDHRYDGTFNKFEVTIKADALTTNNYLSSPITNPYDKNQTIEPVNIEIAIELNDDYTVKNVIVDPNGGLGDSLTCLTK